MRPEELEALLRVTDIDEVVAAINDPALQAERGWDLHDWAYRSAPGSVCLLHCDESGRPTELIVAVRAPGAPRDRLDRIVADFPLPAKLVLLGGNNSSEC
jgi:hypothetical protein